MGRWSHIPGTEKLNKYRNKRTNGYASIKEAAVAANLKMLALAGKIHDYHEQVPFEIVPKWKGMPAVRYIADFTFVENGRTVVADAKGMRTPIYKLKKRLLEQLHGIEIEEM